MIQDFKINPCKECIDNLKLMIKDLEENKYVIFAVYDFTDSSCVFEGKHIVRLISNKVEKK